MFPIADLQFKLLATTQSNDDRRRVAIEAMAARMIAQVSLAERLMRDGLERWQRATREVQSVLLCDEEIPVD